MLSDLLLGLPRKPGAWKLLATSECSVRLRPGFRAVKSLDSVVQVTANRGLGLFFVWFYSSDLVVW